MNAENLAYALMQVLHNFGAVAVVGGAIFGYATQAISALARRRLIGLILTGWILQAASGAGFGAISYLNYGQLPDIHGVALAALFLKMGCAVLGILLALGMLRYENIWEAATRSRAWAGMIALGVIALTAAAFLRWFS